MVPKSKKWIAFTLPVAGLLVITGLYLYVQVWIPNQKLRNMEWLETASQKEIRRVSHQVIRFPVGIHHDAFLALEKVGNKESVPLLISALKWQDQPEDENDIMICTTSHCLEALRSLTGYDAGSDYLAWNKWWMETGSNLPPTHYSHRQISAKPIGHNY